MKLSHPNYLRVLFIIFSAISSSNAAAQTVVPFESKQWKINSQAHLLLEYQGKQALYLKNGSAILDGVELENGIIEFDIAFSGERGFTGVIWRMNGTQNFEDFYFRPHMSGNVDANQYTPVFNGVSGWQLYHGDDYSTSVVYPMNQWIHIKVVIWEDQAQIFIDDMDDPAVMVPELKHEIRSGGIGLRAFVTPAYFSGFSYREIEKAPFERLPKQDTEVPEDMITGWYVSDPFEESRVEAVVAINEEDFTDLKWKNIKSEVTGITNLARLNGIENDKNTVFARLVISSERAQIKKLRLGYSDKVKVFVNGQPVYGGNNTYLSRDYRYLGTIGLFSEVYLPLLEGDNEVWLAVTEAFGGWGIIGRLEDQSGTQLREL